MIRDRLGLYAAAARSRGRSIAGGRFGGVAILLYHRVADLDTDPQLLSLPPRVFDDHLGYLTANCTPVALDDVPALLRSRRLPVRPVVVTFDDGYRDNFSEAKPLLERHGVPATVFVSSGYVGSGREFWWDELERLLLLEPSAQRAPVTDVPIGTSSRRFAVHDASTRRDAYVALHPLLRTRPAAEIDAALVALRTWAGEPAQGTPRPDYLAVDHDELVRLDGGAVSVGAHTRTHVSLAAQPPAVQEREIAGSRSDLSEWLGRPVTTFSYPFGTPSVDVQRVTRRLARDAGHDLAVENWPQQATLLHSRFSLPRYLVRDWPLETFAEWMETEVFPA